MEATRIPGQRAGLTRAAVLAAAHELLTEAGIDALTMRALANRLGVAPNALYSHVRSKSHLLDELLDDALAAVEAPAIDVDDPLRGVAALMTSTYATLTARPDLVPLYLARQGARGANAVRLGEVMDALLARAGVSGSSVPEARRVLIVHTIGFAAFATGTSVALDGDRPIGVQQSREHFSRSLQWLLAGIMGGAAAP
jgi:TetR/AcrR family transcriptional regulator, tetracycline repressor protein